MAFDTTPTKVPTSIGTITIVLRDPDGDNLNRTIRAEVQVLDQNDEVLRLWTGDVQPHLTQAQINGLVNFLNELRIQAENQLLS